MSPSNFLNLAKELQKKPGPAECRSATSRAYYFAFHSARIWLRDSGIGIAPKAAEAHKKIGDAFSSSGDAELEKLSEWLKTLRGWRNNADYALEDPQPENAGKVRSAIQKAEEIAGALKELDRDVERTANAVAKIRVWNKANMAFH
jgi:uncharacterized protein (UPF0332 family)